MLIFSLIFYAWGEPLYILLLIFMTAVDWFLTLKIAESEGIYKRKRMFMALIVIIDLGLLAVFKYGTFILSNMNLLTGFPEKIPNIALPIGISFYTFQLLTYCVDVYRGEVPPQKSFSTLLLYVSMFHQCIAGPIVRYKDICAELEERYTTYNDIYEGILSRLYSKGIRFVVDATGDLLLNTLKYKPFLIKPNKEELQAYMESTQPLSTEALLKCAVEFLEMGIGTAVVSMGREGALFVREGFAAECPALDVKAHSTVGAGDAMVAAMAHAWESQLNEEETIRLCMAASAGAVTTIGTKPPTKEMVENALAVDGK